MSYSKAGNILFVLFLAFLGNGTAWGQSVNDRVRSELTSKELSDKTLKAFESKAVQKLRDFGDRIEILSDPERDTALRKRAREQALGFFVKGETKVSDFPVSQENKDSTTIRALLKQLGRDPEPRVNVRIEDAECSSFQKKEDGTYEGKLSFRMVCTYKRSGEKNPTRKESSYESEVLLKQVSKRFGGKEQKVWECFLGRMEAREN